MSAQHNNNTEPYTSGSLHINNLSSDAQSNFRAPAYSVFMQEYGQGVRYDQVVKIHLNTRLGRYPIIHRIYLIQSRSFVEQNKRDMINAAWWSYRSLHAHQVTLGIYPRGVSITYRAMRLLYHTKSFGRPLGPYRANKQEECDTIQL